MPILTYQHHSPPPAPHYYPPFSYSQYHTPPPSLTQSITPYPSTECIPVPLSNQNHAPALSSLLHDQTQTFWSQCQPPTPSCNEVLPVALTLNTRLHLVWKGGIPYVLSKEISHLLCLSNDLDSSLIQKGICLPSTVITLDDDAEVYLQLVK